MLCMLKHVKGVEGRHTQHENQCILNNKNEATVSFCVHTEKIIQLNYIVDSTAKY